MSQCVIHDKVYIEQVFSSIKKINLLTLPNFGTRLVSYHLYTLLHTTEALFGAIMFRTDIFITETYIVQLTAIISYTRPSLEYTSLK